MSQKDDKSIDLSQTEEEGSTPVKSDSRDVQPTNAPRGFLDSARRNLSEEEASSPAGRRWLIAEMERLDSECAKYRSLQEKHHDLRVDYARLEEGVKKSKWLEILSFVSVSIGAAGFGAAPSYITAPGLEQAGWTMLIGSTVLVIVGVLAKVKS